MTRRWLPWLLWGLSLAFVVIGDGLQVLQAGASGSPGFPGWAAVTLNALAFGTVGALVAYRRPTNAIGWLFLAVGVASAVQLVTAEYATYSHDLLAGRLAGTTFIAWVSQASVAALFAVVVPFMLLLFPDGHFASLRWRVAGQLVAVGGLSAAVAVAIKPGLMGNTEGIRNPLGVPAHGSLLLLLNVLSGLPVLLGLVLGVGSLIVRFLRSHGDQRLQLKWVMFAAACGFGAILLATVA
ncbi:MAG: hypothetical protein M3319_09815, partial [Actinomycetota bacterium]|nr:hypothetical protein [Actinomycetota bacterium]